ncbi:hypothetical protein [Brevibacillus daliensis]|uniref:hypothetical protein n=1 Tax=Brevibacillus daliensis TaxID=2892995 RepID=UPI001E5F0DBC|nr:hypothetical protein [Brevibacillus daliensis]
MASLIKEIEAVGAIVRQAIPNAIVKYQHIPEEPGKDMCVVQYISGGNESETAYHYRIDRTFRIVWFGTSEVDCIRKLEIMERTFGNTLQFKADGYRVITKSFGASQPFQTTGGAFAILATLQAELRQARPQETYEKMQKISVFINE